MSMKTYVFVFVCKECRHNICTPVDADNPEVEVLVTCKACGWTGTVRCDQAKKVLCQDASDLGL
jgi:hypothetical protein